MPLTKLYRGSYGLSNRVQPELIPYNAKTGVTGLQRADNMLIGEAGQLYCRKGSRQVFNSSSCHSHYPVPGGFLFVQEKSDGAFLSLALDDDAGDLVVSEIFQLKHSGYWLSWFEAAGEYWFGTEKERWVASRDMQVRAWPDAEQYMEKHTGIVVEPLPYGRHIAVNGSCVLSAVGSEIFISETTQPSIFRPATGSFKTNGPIRILKPVQTGFYYSDDTAVWFVSGLNPEQYVLKKVLDYPAIEYCAVHRLVSATGLGLESYSLGVLFMTVNGPVFGLPDGTPINLTDKQFAMPKGCNFTKGSMMIVNDSTLIISLA